MKVLKYFLPVAVAATLIAPSLASAACSKTSYHNSNRSRDLEAVQEFVNSKRTISLEEKDCNLSIAGDIRATWAHIDEKVGTRRLRGENGLAQIGQNAVGNDDGAVSLADTARTQPGFSKNEFDIEFNLYIDYICDKAWGVVWLQFDNDAGIDKLNKICSSATQGEANHANGGLFGSGCCEDLCLKKAYMGYNICADGCQRLDIEIGRRPMYNVFNSRMQFQSRFDGILLKYKRDLSSSCFCGNMYWNFGAFVVDERADHYAYVSETGMTDIMGCGLDVSYSFIDWKSLLCHNRNRCHPISAAATNPAGAEFRVHQFSGSYTFDADYICQPIKLYGAFLWNSEAKRIANTINEKENLGFYVGFLVGELCSEGDWSFDAMYQYAEAQVVPGRDFSGVGSNGNNLLGDSLYQAAATTNTTGFRDFTNIQGFHFEGGYAVTDNFFVNSVLEFGREIESAIGGKHTYSKFELQGIYAF